MEDIKLLVSESRANEIINDITVWHNEYILNNEIESEELKENILNIKIQNILFNLKQNPSLCGNLCIKKPHELNPKKWEAIIQLKQYELTRNKEDVAETDMFQCGRCNSKKCTYFTLQTRSCDEGSTHFITCLNCNKRWKQ